MAMTEREKQVLAAALVEKTLEFGADLAGLAAVDSLRNGPSEQLFPRMKDQARDHFAARVTTGLPHGAVKWEAEEKMLLVFALAHPEEHPELDWWIGENDPEGNRLLQEIAGRVKTYAEREIPGMRVFLKPYHVEKGGVYLKDAAAAAGLGCIGKNNLLLTPLYGPRVRLRAVGLSIELPGTPPLSFEPCAGCAAPCRMGCPQEAFSCEIYTLEDAAVLPGRDGRYFRAACAEEMKNNEGEPGETVCYCRRCEMACPVGRQKG